MSVNMHMPLPSLIQHNVFSFQELEFIQNQVLYHDARDDVLYGASHGLYHSWDYYDNKWSEVRHIIDEKIRACIDQLLIVEKIFVLDSSVPYKVHTDSWQSEYQKFKLKPAYTIIIPLDTFNSHTVTFNQYSDQHQLLEAVKAGDVEPTQTPMTSDFVQKHLAHVDPAILKFLTVKEMFAWQKGSVFFFDRRYFHASDNFVANGCKRKQAVVCWTMKK